MKSSLVLVAVSALLLAILAGCSSELGAGERDRLDSLDATGAALEYLTTRNESVVEYLSDAQLLSDFGTEAAGLSDVTLSGGVSLDGADAIFEVDDGSHMGHYYLRLKREQGTWKVYSLDSGG